MPEGVAAASADGLAELASEGSGGRTVAPVLSLSVLLRAMRRVACVLLRRAGALPLLSRFRGSVGAAATASDTSGIASRASGRADGLLPPPLCSSEARFAAASALRVDRRRFRRVVRRSGRRLGCLAAFGAVWRERGALRCHLRDESNPLLVEQSSSLEMQLVLELAEVPGAGNTLPPPIPPVPLEEGAALPERKPSNSEVIAARVPPVAAADAIALAIESGAEREPCGATGDRIGCGLRPSGQAGRWR